MEEKFIESCTRAKKVTLKRSLWEFFEMTLLMVAIKFDKYRENTQKEKMIVEKLRK